MKILMNAFLALTVSLAMWAADATAKQEIEGGPGGFDSLVLTQIAIRDWDVFSQSIEQEVGGGFTDYGDRAAYRAARRNLAPQVSRFVDEDEGRTMISLIGQQLSERFTDDLKDRFLDLSDEDFDLYPSGMNLVAIEKDDGRTVLTLVLIRPHGTIAPKVGVEINLADRGRLGLPEGSMILAENSQDSGGIKGSTVSALVNLSVEQTADLVQQQISSLGWSIQRSGNTILVNESQFRVSFAIQDDEEGGTILVVMGVWQ